MLVAAKSTLTDVKLAFLTSGLASGKDGVGDYTRLLADACMHQGYPSVAVALNDRHIAGEGLTAEDSSQFLRLDANRSWSTRIAECVNFLDRAEVDYVALQYVGYGYHNRGMPLRLGPRVKRLTAGRKLHLMFHELWIGNQPSDSFNDKLIGFLQKRAALRVIRTLKPDVVATSNPAYSAVLRRLGIAAQILPMFGTLTVTEPASSDWLFERVRALMPSIMVREDVWVFAMFGALHAVWPPRPLFDYLLQAAKIAGRALVVASSGRIGPGEVLWSELQREFGRRITFLRLGEQPAQVVSEFLRLADFGISTSPWELIGKSASTACMLDHGLPVIVNRDDVHLQVGDVTPPHDQLIKMDSSLPQRLALLVRKPAASSVHRVATQFLKQLESPFTK